MTCFAGVPSMNIEAIERNGIMSWHRPRSGGDKEMCTIVRIIYFLLPSLSRYPNLPPCVFYVPSEGNVIVSIVLLFCCNSFCSVPTHMYPTISLREWFVKGYWLLKFLGIPTPAASIDLSIVEIVNWEDRRPNVGPPEGSWNLISHRRLHSSILLFVYFWKIGRSGSIEPIVTLGKS